MKRHYLLAACCLLALGGCHRDQAGQGPMERTGAAVDRAGRNTGQALGRAADSTGAAMHRTGDWIRDKTE